MKTSIFAIACAALALSACDKEAPKPDTAAIEQQLQANEARWNRAYAERDAEALAGMYADDAALANPGEALVRGKDAIRKATAAFAADKNLKVSFQANRIQVAASGDLAYTRGRYTLTMTNPDSGKPETSTGHYLTVWQKQADGSWKAVEDFITPGTGLPVSEGAQPIL
ncbi:MAG: YybH family protein [Alphaproteobacteria bacterium]